MPIEGFPNSRLPGWADAGVRVLASHALGAGFLQMLIDLPAGKVGRFDADPGVELFYYVMSGTGRCAADGDHPLEPGSFGLLPPGVAVHFAAQANLQLLIHQKFYEPAAGVAMFSAIHRHERDIPKAVWADNPHSLLQTLIPDDFAYDMAMNIFTFDPGFGLPIVETHVMEHGAMILQGKGLYFLKDQWMEVEKDDFIWMGPYCPQSFYATGPTPAKYIYYKNVNRAISVRPR